jgi:hypothetical protein
MNIKHALIAAAALSGIVLASGSASAMPNGLPAVGQALAGSDVQDVRWVCGPVRCWWRPNWYGGYAYGPAYYGPRVWVGPRWRAGWGWRRRWW